MRNGSGWQRLAPQRRLSLTGRNHSATLSNVMQHPKVSVIVPNYNHAPYLSERLDSILNQTYNDLELIIIDDASTDESHRILTRYYSKPRVRIIVNSRNSGAAFPQWNRGITLAIGDYVWIAESDDSAHPRFLETLVPLLDENPHIGLAYCQSRLINREGTNIGDSLNWTSDLHPERWKSDFINDGREEIRKYLIYKNTIPNASAVIARRSVLNRTLPVDTSFKLCGDWMHWGKVLLQTDLAYVATPLNNWRLESSNSRLEAPGIVEWNEGQAIIRHFTTELGYTEAETSEILMGFAERCMSWVAASADVRPS
jgi:glycosyltransferase involved in cell wall biosynthesis